MNDDLQRQILIIEEALKGKWTQESKIQYLEFRMPPFAGANAQLLKDNLPDFKTSSLLEYNVIIEQDNKYINIIGERNGYKETVKYLIIVLSSGTGRLTIKNVTSGEEIHFNRLGKVTYFDHQ